MERFTTSVLISLLFLSLGCAFKTDRQFLLDYEQALIIDKLNSKNIKLKTARAYTKIKIDDNRNKTYVIRGAFAYSLPDKIRIVLMNDFNIPIITIVSDGKKIIFGDMRTSKTYEKELKKSIIADNIIGFPIDIKSLLMCISGTADIMRDRIKEYDSSGDEHIVVLRDNTRITVDKKRIIITKIENFITPERIRRIEIADYKPVGEYILPHKIIITDPKRETATITIRKYETDIRISDTAFTSKE